MLTLNAIWNFLNIYWLDIVIWGLLVTGIILAILKKRNNVLVNIARQAVIAMEEQWKSGTGAIKKVEALEWLRTRIPITLKPFITIATLDKAIERAWTWLKAAMDDETKNVKDVLLGAQGK